MCPFEEGEELKVLNCSKKDEENKEEEKGAPKSCEERETLPQRRYKS